MSLKEIFMHINVYFVIYHKINTHLFLWVNLALPQVGFWSHFSRFGRPHVSQNFAFWQSQVGTPSLEMGRWGRVARNTLFYE